MNDTALRVVAELRVALAKKKRGFVDALENWVRQILADMVEGRLLKQDEADDVRASVFEFVRVEAFARLAAGDALRVLDMLKMYGLLALEAERPRLESARAAKFPPPPAADWPEIDELRRLAAAPAGICRLAPPITNAYFTEVAKNNRTPCPTSSSRSTRSPMASIFRAAPTRT